MNNLGKYLYIAVLAGLMQWQFSRATLPLTVPLHPMFVWAVFAAVVVWTWRKQPWTCSLKPDFGAYAALLCYFAPWVSPALGFHSLSARWPSVAFLVCACVCTWRFLQQKPHLKYRHQGTPKAGTDLIFLALLVLASWVTRNAWVGLGVAVTLLGYRWLMARYPGAFGIHPVLHVLTLAIGLYGITSFLTGAILQLASHKLISVAMWRIPAGLSLVLAIWLLVQGRRQGWFVFELRFPTAIAWLLLLGGLLNFLIALLSSAITGQVPPFSVLTAWQLLAIGTMWHTILTSPKWLKASSATSSSPPKTTSAIAAGHD